VVAVGGWCQKDVNPEAQLENESFGLVESFEEDSVACERPVWVVLFVAVSLLGWAADDAAVTIETIGIDIDAMPVAVTEFEGVQQNLYKDGRVYIGGQPTEEALARFKALGVTAVVNLRTPGEMENRDVVPYDEAAAVAELGMEYIWIPLGGDHPYEPAAVVTFAEVMSEHRSPVFLHCTMAWRASYVWSAYLIQFHSVPLRAALARGEAIAIPPSPLEGLLGEDLTVAYEQ
jgi:protein tyrosine phosphatase (PTP) superfamily phosphohydrolase (DUF442 family)